MKNIFTQWRQKLIDFKESIITTISNNQNISEQETIINIKILFVAIIFSLLVSISSTLNHFGEYYFAIAFLLLLLVFIWYIARITKDIRKHYKKIRQLKTKYSYKERQPKTVVRGIKIFLSLFTVLLIAYWVFDINFFNNNLEFVLFDELRYEIKNLDDKSFVKLSSFILTAPIFFTIWAFRDKNKLLELENTRKDTNLKEFQQLQQWATGNIEGDAKDEDKTALQISALHSLRGYLKGEYGESFRRGAYEIFRSTLETQHKDILDKVKNKKFDNIRDAINNSQLTKQLNIIASEEWFNLLINHDFPTAEISLVGVDLNGKYLQHKKYGKKLNLANSNLSYISLIFTNLSNANLSNSVLLKANLAHTNLSYSDLSGAYLKSAKLINSDLNNTKLINSNLYSTNLTGANLLNSDLNGAELLFSSITQEQINVVNHPLEKYFTNRLKK